MQKDIEFKIQAAKRELYRSVVKVNEKVEKEVEFKVEGVKTFGVKNTNSIPKKLFNKFRNSKNYLFLTVDKMSDKGRSIDTDLINPITYRCMTGSSSGAVVNIIKGINDMAIGTDGGGSVLAPALSCNLYSIIGAGVDLLVEGDSKSTDSINFIGSIGFVGKNLKDIIEGLEFAIDVKLDKDEESKTNVYIPKKGEIILPTGEDMHDKIKGLVLKLPNYNFIPVDFKDIEERNNAITVGEKLLKDGLILTYEGPMDVYGYGETIQKSFNGIAAKEITKSSGKYMIKVANMMKATAITIPSDEIASGFLVIGKHGIDGAKECAKLAKDIDSTIEISPIFKRFFLNQEKQVWNFVE